MGSKWPVEVEVRSEVTRRGSEVLRGGQQYYKCFINSFTQSYTYFIIQTLRVSANEEVSESVGESLSHFHKIQAK